MADRAGEPRELVVTVGTSLLASASWRAEGPFEGLFGYSGWLERKWQESPGLRRSRGWRTAGQVQQLLQQRPPEQLTQYFDWTPTRPLRYSGELTTLIRLHEREGAGELTEWFRRAYPQVRLVCSTNPEDGGRLAAEHLRAILEGPLQHPGVELAEVLTHGDLDLRLGDFGAFLHALAGEENVQRADLVVTGGFKAFAVLAGRWVATQTEGRDWRAVYLHEDDIGRLIREGVDERGAPTLRVDADSVTQFQWPGGPWEETR